MGLKPSAMRGEARLRGLWRIISSKTIISVYTPPEAGALHDTAKSLSEEPGGAHGDHATGEKVTVVRIGSEHTGSHDGFAWRNDEPGATGWFRSPPGD